MNKNWNYRERDPIFNEMGGRRQPARKERQGDVGGWVKRQEGLSPNIQMERKGEACSVSYWNQC